MDDIVIPLDEAWSAIVDLFSERNWTIQTIDKSSGIIATDWMTGGETYLDCGNAPLAVVHWTKLRLNVRAKAAENRTHIVVNVVGQQLRQVSDRFATVECTSLGRIEAQIHRAVRARSGQEK